MNKEKHLLILIFVDVCHRVTKKYLSFFIILLFKLLKQNYEFFKHPILDHIHWHFETTHTRMVIMRMLMSFLPEKVVEIQGRIKTE